MPFAINYLYKINPTNPLWDTAAFALAPLGAEEGFSFQVPAQPAGIAIGVSSIFQQYVLAYAGMVVAVYVYGGNYAVYEGYTQVVSPAAHSASDVFKIARYDSTILVLKNDAVIHSKTYSGELRPTAAAFTSGDAILDAALYSDGIVERGSLSDITTSTSGYATATFPTYGYETLSLSNVGYATSGTAVYSELGETTLSPSSYYGAISVKYPGRGIIGVETLTTSEYGGVNPGGKADGDGDAEISIVVLGSSGYAYYAEGNAALPAVETIAYELAPPDYATGLAEIPLTASADGNEVFVANDALFLLFNKIEVLAADYEFGFADNIELPAIEVSAQDIAPATMDLDADAPSYSLDGQLEPTDQTRVIQPAPGYALQAYTGLTAKPTAPGYTLTGASTVTELGRLDAQAPDYSLTASLLTGSSTAADVSAPSYAIAAQTGSRLTAQAPGYYSTGAAMIGITSSLLAQAPTYSSVAAVAAGTFSQVIADAPSYSPLYGLLAAAAPGYGAIIEVTANITPTFTAYAMNTRLPAAVTQYEAWEFELMFRFAGQHYGVKDGDLYLLEGTDDNGAAIAAYFTLPPMDFGTPHLKRLPYVYIGCRSDDGLAVSVTVDEARTLNAATQTVGRNRRARLARGLKGRFWAVKVKNVAGNYLGVDTVELLPEIQRRKV